MKNKVFIYCEKADYEKIAQDLINKGFDVIATSALEMDNFTEALIIDINKMKDVSYACISDQLYTKSQCGDYIIDDHIRAYKAIMRDLKLKMVYMEPVSLWRR